MSWLARDPERRCDPTRVLPGCQSVVVVFMNYYPGELPQKPTDVPRGRIARYALGVDYHDVVRPKLRELASVIGDQDAKCYVDTGAILERSAAEAAGLGWVGKNANLIVPGVGSYGFLGVILTRVALDPTVPTTTSCGSCQACLPACPTGAIRIPGVIDARRCISYLTIELRGVVPRELRSLMGDWVFGCDDCQDPCPWNKKSPASDEQRFRGQVEGIYPTLEGLLKLTALDFKIRFRGSPVTRARREGLVRNAAIALGNCGHSHGRDPLREALANDPAASVRVHVAWALGRLGDSHGLQAALHREEDHEVREEIVWALENL